MTQSLERAITEIRKLSAEEQDRIAAELMTLVSDIADQRTLQLSDEQLAELRRRRAEVNPSVLTLEQASRRLRRLRT